MYHVIYYNFRHTLFGAIVDPVISEGATQMCSSNDVQITSGRNCSQRLRTPPHEDR